MQITAANHSAGTLLLRKSQKAVPEEESFQPEGPTGMPRSRAMPGPVGMPAESSTVPLGSSPYDGATLLGRASRSSLQYTRVVAPEYTGEQRQPELHQHPRKCEWQDEIPISTHLGGIREHATAMDADITPHGT